MSTTVGRCLVTNEISSVEPYTVIVPQSYELRSAWGINRFGSNIHRKSTVFTETEYPYHFVHFHGFPTAFVRLNNEHPGDESFVLYQRPFENFPTVKSSVHPYAVIQHVARTILEHNEKKIAVDPPKFLQPHLDLCVAIYKQWTTPRSKPKPDPELELVLSPILGESPSPPRSLGPRRLKRVHSSISDEDEALSTKFNNSRSRVKGNTSASKQ